MSKKSKKDKGQTPRGLYGITEAPIPGTVLEVRMGKCPNVGPNTECYSYRALTDVGGQLIMHWWNAYVSDGSRPYTGRGHNGHVCQQPVKDQAAFNEACENASQTLHVIDPADYPPQAVPAMADELDLNEEL